MEQTDKRPIPGQGTPHPFASYAVSNHPMGGHLVDCWCSSCGAHWRKHCRMFTTRGPGYLYKFGKLHEHQ